MREQTMLNQDEFGALNLFDFYSSRESDTSFYYNSPKFYRRFHKIPLKIRFRNNSGSYPRLSFTILDDKTNDPILTKWGNSHDLVKDLIEKREFYFSISYAYNVFKIISKFNIISNVDFSKSIDGLEIWGVSKEFEESTWGGRDKDNKFCTYTETQFFITLGNDMLIDVYLRSLLPSKIKLINCYEEYKATADTKQDHYSIQRFTDQMKKDFLSQYAYEDHIDIISKDM